MNVTINTDLIKTLGITPAVILAICQASPYLTPRLIAQMLGRDYSRTTAIIRDLRKRGYLPKRKATAASINVAKEIDKL